MKLLLVSRRFPPDVRSGTETVAANLYEQARRRHEVRLVAGYVRDRTLIPAEALGVDLRDKGAGLAQLAMWRAARSAVRSFRPDAVLSNSIEVPRTGAPTVCIVHDLNFGHVGRSGTHRLRELLYRGQSRRLDRIVVVSEATKRAMARIGVADDKMVVIPSGVDVERFRPPDAPPRPVEDEPSLEGRTRICYPGRILPGKGQHVAIDAVARLSPQQKKRVHLRIVGSIADRHYYDQLRIQAYGQPVSFHPDVPDIVPFYQEADLVLFPTLLQEGFGYTAVEAMACGKPVIWFEQPAVREATGGLGVPVPYNDAAAMRDEIRGFLEEPERLQAVGAEARAWVVARYAWPGVWARYEEVLRAVAS